MFGTEQRDVGADAGIAGVLLEIVVDSGARVGKQYLLDELDRRGRAFDVQQDRANAGQRNGM